MYTVLYILYIYCIFSICTPYAHAPLTPGARMQAASARQPRHDAGALADRVHRGREGCVLRRAGVHPETRNPNWGVAPETLNSMKKVLGHFKLDRRIRSSQTHHMELGGPNSTLETRSPNLSLLQGYLDHKNPPPP